MNNVKSIVIWLLVALAGAIAFAMLALSRGEHVNAVWLVIAAISCYSIAYRFYSLFIAKKCLNWTTVVSRQLSVTMTGWIMFPLTGRLFRHELTVCADRYHR